MWFGLIKAVSAVRLDYLLIKSLDLDKPPDNVLILIIQ